MIILGLFLPVLYKNICCGYSLELHQPPQSEALLMSSHNIHFLCRNKKKISKNYHHIHCTPL